MDVFKITRNVITLILLPLVSSGNYHLLSELDPLCDRSILSTDGYALTVAPDELTLQEQLVLMRSSSNSTRVSVPHNLSTLGLSDEGAVVGVCPGVVVVPYGRFVQRTFTEGHISFWLLRLEALLNCSAVGPHMQHVIFDQWLVNQSWLTLRMNDDHETSEQHLLTEPDRSDRLDCAQVTQGQKISHLRLGGYLRRLRLRWQLDGGNNSTNLNSDRQGATSFDLHIRLTARMLIEGNFSNERKRSLCEFFSGFWCPAVKANHTAPVVDSQACVPATMRCDGLPDCEPSSHTEGALTTVWPISNNNESADEMNCDWSTVSIDQLTPGCNQTELSNDSSTTTSDRWTTNLPWIVLTPVPLVLICALIRICSQKRHLDVAEEETDLCSWQQQQTCQLIDINATISTTTTAAAAAVVDSLAVDLRKMSANGLPSARFGLCRNLSLPSRRISRLSSVAEVDDEGDCDDFLMGDLSMTREGRPLTAGLSAPHSLASGFHLSYQHPSAHSPLSTGRMELDHRLFNGSALTPDSCKSRCSTGANTCSSSSSASLTASEGHVADDSSPPQTAVDEGAVG